MRDYGSIPPSYWHGQTGRQIRAMGPLALLVGCYLQAAPTANLIGLYYLPLVTLAHETATTPEECLQILRAFDEIGFASYDPETETVWVRSMAFEQTAKSIPPPQGSKRDNKWKAIVRELTAQNKSPFFKPFIAIYGDPYNLHEHFNSPSEGGRGDTTPPPSEGGKGKVPSAPSEGVPNKCRDPLPVAEALALAEALAEPLALAEAETRGSAPRPPHACRLPIFLANGLKAVGVAREADQLHLLGTLGRLGLAGALAKLKTKGNGRNPAGLLMTHGVELAQEGQALLEEAARQALEMAPGALADARWAMLPVELREDLEVQAAWAAWHRTEAHLQAHRGDDGAVPAERSARRELVNLLADRHPDATALRLQIDTTVQALASCGMTPQAQRLMAMTSALGLAAPANGRA